MAEFVCTKRSDFTGNVDDDGNVILDDDVIEKVAKFLFLKNALSSGGGVQEAVTARIKFGWKKFKDIASVRCKRVVSLKKS